MQLFLFRDRHLDESVEQLLHGAACLVRIDHGEQLFPDVEQFRHDEIGHLRQRHFGKLLLLLLQWQLELLEQFLHISFALCQHDHQQLLSHHGHKRNPPLRVLREPRHGVVLLHLQQRQLVVRLKQHL